MTNLLGIDADLWNIILAIVVAIETFILIVLALKQKKSGEEITPTTASLFEKILEKVPNPSDVSKIPDQKIDEKLRKIKEEEINPEITEIAEKLKKTGVKINEIESNIQELVNRTVEKTLRTKDEVMKETVRDAVLEILDSAREKDLTRVRVNYILNELIEDFSFEDIFRTIYQLGKEGRINIPPEVIARGYLTNQTTIFLPRRKKISQTQLSSFDEMRGDAWPESD